MTGETDMKMKITSSKLFEVKTKVQSVEASSFTSKNGADTTIVLVKTDAGTFSNFQSEWDKQSIDIETLNEGDELEITYKVFVKPHSERKFMNFVKIKKVNE